MSLSRRTRRSISGAACAGKRRDPVPRFPRRRYRHVGRADDRFALAPCLHAESADTTHDVWAVARDFALGNEEFSAGLRASLEAAFEHEDMPIIRDVHRLMAGRDFGELKPIVLTGDSGEVRAGGCSPG